MIFLKFQEFVAIEDSNDWRIVTIFTFELIKTLIKLIKIKILTCS